jgi:cell division protein FtsB
MALLPPPPAKYKAWFGVCVLFLLLFVVAAVWGDHGLMDMLRLRTQQRDQEQTASALQQRNHQLRERIERLRTDDGYLEQLARERLGLVKKGEVIYRVIPPPADAH